MVNPDAYPDQFEMVDLARHRADSESSSLSSTANHDSAEKYLLRVIPKLIRWRLYLFYAPFFRGTGFERSLSNMNNNTTTNAQHIGAHIYPPRNLPPPSQRNQRTLHPIINANATHKARLLATSTLCSLEDDLQKLNLPLLCASYTHEKEIHQRRTAVFGPHLASLWPCHTMSLFESVSSTLDIPLRQIEAAVTTYTLHHEILQYPGEHMEARRPCLAAEKLCADALALEKRWCDLAAIVADDLEDVSGPGAHAFSRFERSLRGTQEEVRMFRGAVDACAAAYERELDGEMGLYCEHRGGCRSARNRSRGGRVLGGRLGSQFMVMIGVKMPEKGSRLKTKLKSAGDGNHGRVVARWSRCLAPLKALPGSSGCLASIREE